MAGCEKIKAGRRHVLVLHEIFSVADWDLGHQKVPLFPVILFLIILAVLIDLETQRTMHIVGGCGGVGVLDVGMDLSVNEDRDARFEGSIGNPRADRAM